MLSRRARRRFLARYPWLPSVAIAGVVVMVSLSAYVLNHASTKPKKTPAPAAVSVLTDSPSEAKITVYHSTVTGIQPKYLRLPSIKAEGYVQVVGIDQNKQVAVPTNIHLAGWFVQTPAPGEPGLSIIDGHLDGLSQPGIFARLGELKAGDIFTVELATGKVRRFEVMSTQSYALADAAAALFSQDPAVSSQLNLITCAGTFKASKGYDHRIIVTSRLLGT